MHSLILSLLALTGSARAACPTDIFDETVYKCWEMDPSASIFVNSVCNGGVPSYDIETYAASPASLVALQGALNSAKTLTIALDTFGVAQTAITSSNGDNEATGWVRLQADYGVTPLGSITTTTTLSSLNSTTVSDSLDNLFCKDIDINSVPSIVNLEVTADAYADTTCGDLTADPSDTRSLATAAAPVICYPL